MDIANRLSKICIVAMMVIFFCAVLAGAQGKTEENKELMGLVEVKECEGVGVSHCELAKNLVLTLKMGEDLICEACFIQLQALGIAPGEEWSYADPHKVVTQEDIQEVALEIHRAYNNGMVRVDGFVAAAGINSFCRDIKGISPPPEKEEKGQPEKQPEEQPTTATPPQAEETGVQKEKKE
ncbi:MAG: hypothetical protein JXA50_11020 [Deltaproteobacteria bacterium]|nr:hypothetical protein [Deltaproteobacteria bacterium]